MTTEDSPQIAAIKHNYRLSFPEKAALVASHLEARRSGKESDLTVSDTHEFMHKLAGSASMYGYEGIASVCRAAMGHLQNDRTENLIEALVELNQLLDINSETPER
jgi:HPt (histidine-containing phosphotransfer) domain-containing protein